MRMKNPAVIPKDNSGAAPVRRPACSHGAWGLLSAGISGRLARCLLRIEKPRVPLPEARGHVEVTFAAPIHQRHSRVAWSLRESQSGPGVEEAGLRGLVTCWHANGPVARLSSCPTANANKNAS